MSFNQGQGPRRVHFADDPEVRTYSPDTSPSSASSGELLTPSDNRTLPLLSMSDYIARCTTWIPGSVPSTVLVPSGYMLVGPTAPPAPVTYHVPTPAPAPMLAPARVPVPVPALPAIHPALVRPPFRWDVRATALPPTLTLAQGFRNEPAFAPPLGAVTLRFAPPDGAVSFAHAIAVAPGSARPLRVVDVLRAVHAALYAPAPPPRTDTVRRAAEVAAGYRALGRDGGGRGGLYRVDLWPVAPNRVDGARLCFVGLEWGAAQGEVHVLLVPGA